MHSETPRCTYRLGDFYLSCWWMSKVKLQSLKVYSKWACTCQYAAIWSSGVTRARCSLSPEDLIWFVISPSSKLNTATLKYSSRETWRNKRHVKCKPNHTEEISWSFTPERITRSVSVPSVRSLSNSGPICKSWDPTGSIKKPWVYYRTLHSSIKVSCRRKSRTSTLAQTQTHRVILLVTVRMWWKTPDCVMRTHGTPPSVSATQPNNTNKLRSRLVLLPWQRMWSLNSLPWRQGISDDKTIGVSMGN